MATVSEFEAVGTIQAALSRSVDYFLRSQAPSGYWVGELESNATITAEYLFLRRLLQISDPQREADIVRHLLNGQVDGGWAAFYGGPPDLNITIEAAVALQLAGMPLDAPELKQATEVVCTLGGLGKSRVFTRIWLALLGALSWDTVPAMPPEMMFLPQSTPLNIYRFASWARGTLVPLLVILAQPPEYPGPAPEVGQFLVGETQMKPPRRPRFDARANFQRLDYLLKRSSGVLRRNPWRQRALSAARRWIESHQEADGGWGGIQPVMINSVLALSTFDPDALPVQLGLEGIESFCIRDEAGFRMQACVSPCWDTPWVMLALSEAGLPPGHPALRRAAGWLLDQQSKVYGDWSLKAPGVPAGGWPFEFYNSQYPDTDDTALVLAAFRRTNLELGEAFSDGVQWMICMQNDDGGWAAFDRDNNVTLVEQIPFCDFGEVLDPSSADVTAHVLETLAQLGYPRSDPCVQRGLAYLWGEQEPDGAWFGRWGVNYIYGTAAALMALEACEFSAEDGRISKAANWLRRHQNEDGGWGESCLSYTDQAWRGRGASTASQTAWAILGLLSVRGVEDLALQAGVRWLLENQKSDGTWDEPYFTGTGFPGDFYLNYHEYRNYFPVLALARIHQALSRGQGFKATGA
ncbi:MAG TPA: squalene--hopene cyclase [Anaerolineales bacterium]|jgi:squalene-hopene/tetraprenyl-beta-curcumene cyclase|nr:squalene--hopene cyclase [Anaerolineales bacterium]